MKVIGVTGGIGSGKSTLARLLGEAYGIPLIDADALAKTAAERPDVIGRIRSAFGAAYLNADDTVNREALANLIFSDEAAKRTLNAIINPIVRSLYFEEIERLRTENAPYAIYDCPLLIEENLEGDVDVVVLVYADAETQIARVVRRSGCSAEHAWERIAAQMDADEKIPRADIVVYNTGTLEELKNSIPYLYREIERYEP